MNFNDIYRGPFKIDEYCPVYIFSDNDVMTLMIENDDFDNDFMFNLVDKLNCQSSLRFSVERDPKDPVHLIINDKSFLVRGWGHLTGRLNLSNEEAAKIQDDFIDWMIEALEV